MAVEERHRLSSTSALVLKWTGGEPHVSAASKAYLSALDFGAADELFQRCDSVWPHYGEVIRNRKYAVLELAREAIAGGLTQTVILAAGFDALSIELVSEFPHQRIFDVDRENMIEKAGLTRRLASAATQNIRHVTADLGDSAELQAKLQQAGWAASLPSLVVAEGISYYLPQETLANLLGLFRRPAGKFLLEYLVEEEQIEDARRDIPDRVFAAIMDQVKLKSICRYSKTSLASLADELGYEPASHSDMQAMERLRTGKSHFFRSPESGWIEILLLKA